MSDIWNQSSTAVLIMSLGKPFNYLRERAKFVYSGSRTFKLIGLTRERILAYSRNSFLQRISQIRKEDNRAILESSKFIARLAGIYIRWQARISGYFTIRATKGLPVMLKDKFYYLPLKSGGIVMVAGILANIFFSALLNKEISALGWFLRLLFLFLGTGGLFSGIDWPSLKNNSLILKLFSR